MNRPVTQPAVLCLLEIAGLTTAWTPDLLRGELERLDLGVKVVGDLAGRSAVLVETDIDTASDLTERITQSARGIEVIELRRHIDASQLDPGRLRQLIVDGRRDGRLAVGAAAVERAMQRRRLDALILAGGLPEDYRATVRVVVDHNAYRGPLVISELNRDELGEAAGVRRAGCVGILRGRRRVSL